MEQPNESAEFHRTLGLCLEEWQGLEHALFIIFMRVTLYQFFQWPMVFFTHIRAFDQRCALIDKIATLTLKGRPELIEWQKLHARLTVTGKKRDRLVHYAIEADENMGRRIQPPLFHPRMWGEHRLTEKNKEHFIGMPELEIILNEIISLSNDLLVFEKLITQATYEVRLEHAEALLKQRDLLSNTDNLLEVLARASKTPK